MRATVIFLDSRILYRDYIMGPTEVGMQDPCPLSLPEISWASAEARSQSSEHPCALSH